jgi:hypothetical protein
VTAVSAREDILSVGFHLSHGVYGVLEVSELIKILEQSVAPANPHALRNLLERVPELLPLTHSERLANHVASILGAKHAAFGQFSLTKPPGQTGKWRFIKIEASRFNGGRRFPVSAHGR